MLKKYEVFETGELLKTANDADQIDLMYGWDYYIKL